MSKETPVEEFTGLVKSAAATRKDKELAHLHQWKTTQDPDHLAPLLKMYEPVVANAVRKYRAPSVPEAAMHAEAVSHVIKAFESYDPKRGAALNTHVQNNLMKLHRYNSKLQNVGYIPADSTKWIGPIDRAHAQLTDELGRAPTHAEVGSHLGISGTKVKNIQSIRRADIASSAFEDSPIDHGLARDQEVLSLLPYALNDRQKEVFSYLYGDKQHLAPKVNGRVSMSELAKKLNLSSSQVSRAHTAIGDAYKKYK